MALSANSMPFNVPNFIAPFDAANSFMAAATPKTAATITSTGYFGDPTQLDVGLGRIEGYWALDLTALKVSATDETYTFHLLGSNDSSWGNGNVEILQSQNFGAVRTIATIIGASPVVLPSVGPAGTMMVFPFTNLRQRIVYRYLRLYAVLAGTSPSVTALSWISPDSNC